MTAPLYLPFLNINPSNKDSFLLYRGDINNLLSDSASHRQLQRAETNNLTSLLINVFTIHLDLTKKGYQGSQVSVS